MVVCTLSSVRFVVRWKKRIKYLLLSGIHFVSMQVRGKLRGIIVKKGDWYHSKDYRHAKNYELFASCKHWSVATQLANEVAREN